MASIDKAMTKLKIEIMRVADPKKLISERDLSSLGEMIVAEMKKVISAGTSPITGGQFPRYKNPDSYPGKLKSHAPVNLKLTGQFLSSLAYRIFRQKGSSGVEVHFKNNLAERKEIGHRTGERGQPRRPIIPTGAEKLSPDIRAKIARFIQRLVDRAKLS